MLFWLILLFIILPWIELALLFRVAAVVGPVATLALIVLTGVIGASLTRWEGARALNAIRTSLNKGEMPARGIVDAVLIFAAGLVLITPGFITDAAGFLLLVPPARDLIRNLVVRQLRKHAVIHVHGVSSDEERRSRPDAAPPGVIDVQAEDLDEHDEGER